MSDRTDKAVRALYAMSAGLHPVSRQRSFVRRRGQAVPVYRTRLDAQARYDAAETTDDNRRHWANADLLSADADACFGTRQILRSRSRYERANNAWYKGIVRTHAYDLIGRGPRLQMLTKSDNLNRAIEREWAKWAKAVRLAAKLRLMCFAYDVDGEAFAILGDNPSHGHAVSLDLITVEADRVTTPDINVLMDNQLDGIVLDANGNPVEYHVLKRHPGDTSFLGTGQEYDRVLAEDMIHWFEPERPGQHRGVPVGAPSLQLFADLRRYRKAVLAAAETAAQIAGILHTNAPPDEGPDEVNPMLTVELLDRLLLTAPMGWDMTQVKAEQPATTHGEFVKGIVNEAARPWSMPRNVAMCDSSEYNYASGRLDRQTYARSHDVEHGDIEVVIVDRTFDAWTKEAVRIDGLLSPGMAAARALDDFPHQWFWKGRPHVDPAKEAIGQERRLANKATNLAREHAEQGLDWQEEIDQCIREELYEKRRRRELAEEMGLSEAEADAEPVTAGER